MRLKNGKAEVLDGPYADTKEQLAGYYLIDVPDLDAALAWAAKCPGAAVGTNGSTADLADADGQRLSGAMTDALRAREAAERVARRSYGKLVAYVSARTRDVAAAEDALSEAFAAALADWQESGIPDNPEAWLMAVARRRTIDAARRAHTAHAAADHVRLIAEELDMAATSDIPDERLALMFACAHPAIDEGIRAPLIQQTILGFDAATIASAFLVAPATMGQRLSRAKQKIKQAGIPFRVPERTDIRERLDAVLAAIYAAFAEGWTDPAGTQARQRNLADEAIWLGRLVVFAAAG